MKIIKSENIVAFDVDDTLACWDKHHNKPGQGKLQFNDPNDNNREVYLTPHKVHLRLMRQYKGRGFTVIVWSGNGHKWAKEVVDKLDISEYVDFIMTKPSRHVDDQTDKEKIIGVHLFFKNSED